MNSINRVGGEVPTFKNRLYTLENREPLACHNVFEWAVVRAKGLDPAHGEPWRVGLDKVGGYEISTVFMGVDMRYSAYHEDEPPIVFETMMFSPDGKVEGMGRSTTFDLAESRHREVVQRVRRLVEGGQIGGPDG